jgi:hypothetical protein
VDGERISPAELAGHWMGKTHALPTRSNQPLDVELKLGDETGNGTDSLYLRTDQITFSGAVVAVIEGRVLVIGGTVLPRARIGRTGAPVPFGVEIRCALYGRVLKGVAKVWQSGAPSMPRLDAVGRFEARLAPN